MAWHRPLRQADHRAEHRVAGSPEDAAPEVDLLLGAEAQRIAGAVVGARNLDPNPGARDRLQQLVLVLRSEARRVPFETPRFANGRDRSKYDRAARVAHRDDAVGKGENRLELGGGRARASRL